MATLPGETYRLAHPSLPDLENPAYVSYGRPFDETCAHHVVHTFQAQRVYVLASKSLANNTNEVEKLKTALGDRLAGVRVGIAPHTPWNEVLDATRDALSKRADCLITIGGGSLVDGAKAMVLFMANDVTTMPQLIALQKKLGSRADMLGKKAAEFDCVAPTVPLICIPTTLSGGEYSHSAGGTDTATGHKSTVGHPFCGPRLVINDPKLTITAPEWVWLSTGVRGVDHCVESYCQLLKEDPVMDEAAITGFKKIVPNLLATRDDWTDEDARLQCMLGVNAVTIMSKRGIMSGGSHGIGHQLGPLGVGHGQTSCILLPAVMKYNAEANDEKQDRLKAIMWSEPTIAKVLTEHGLKSDTSDAGDALDAIFRKLGMPRTLKEMNIGRDKFDALAANSLKDACCQANPIPLTKAEQVLEILEMCAGV